MVRGIPLIRTKSADRIKTFREGYVYCKRLQYYIDLERETGDRIVGDEWEASLPIRDAIIYIPEEGFVQQVKDTAIPFTVTNNFVLCMTGCKVPKDAVNHSLVSDEIVNYGDTSLVITDRDEFIKRLQKGATDKGFHMVKQGFVNYYDDKADNIWMIQDVINDSSNIAFWKRKRYERDSEYRFLFAGDTDRDHIKFPIGDISDISVVVNSSQIHKACVKYADE